MSDTTPNGTPPAPPAGYPGASAPYESAAGSYPAPPAPSPGEAHGYGATAPYATAPAYGAPAYGYGYPAAPKTNALAITSLVSSIAGFVILPFLASVVAVITGHLALRQLRTSGEGGRGMALAGTIVGWVGVGLGLLVVVLGVIWFTLIFGAIASSGGGTYDYS